MRIPLLFGAGVLAFSGSVMALQPVAFPMRSQSVAQQSIDSAMCYGFANQHTKVSMATLSQAPERPHVEKIGPVHQVAVATPLPEGMFPGAAAPSGASMVEVSLSGKPLGARGGSASSVDAPMPPLPPPESPMARYWQSFSACMIGRGYMVK
jgi:hypothetical protein